MDNILESVCALLVPSPPRGWQEAAPANVPCSKHNELLALLADTPTAWQTLASKDSETLLWIMLKSTEALVGRALDGKQDEEGLSIAARLAKVSADVGGPEEKEASDALEHHIALAEACVALKNEWDKLEPVEGEEASQKVLQWLLQQKVPFAKLVSALQTCSKQAIAAQCTDIMVTFRQACQNYVNAVKDLACKACVARLQEAVKQLASIGEGHSADDGKPWRSSLPEKCSWPLIVKHAEYMLGKEYSGLLKKHYNNANTDSRVD